MYKFYVNNPDSKNSLTDNDICAIFGTMQNENLIDVFFFNQTHDLESFTKWVMAEGRWFYGVKNDAGNWAGIGILDGFMPTMTACYVHHCAFKAGRDIWQDVALTWFNFLKRVVGINTLIGITPACYRYALKINRELGFIEQMRIKKSIILKRKYKSSIITDAVITKKEL